MKLTPPYGNFHIFLLRLFKISFKDFLNWLRRPREFYLPDDSIRFSRRWLVDDWCLDTQTDRTLCYIYIDRWFSRNNPILHKYKCNNFACTYVIFTLAVCPLSRTCWQLVGNSCWEHVWRNCSEQMWLVANKSHLFWTISQIALAGLEVLYSGRPHRP